MLRRVFFDTDLLFNNYVINSYLYIQNIIMETISLEQQSISNNYLWDPSIQLTLKIQSHYFHVIILNY